MKGGEHRRRPYTVEGLARVTCSRPGCDKPAAFEWSVRSCARGGPVAWRALCVDCDIELNRRVVEWWWPAEADRLMAGYEKHVRATGQSR